MPTDHRETESFDPYRIWLGIPVERRPASPYRLLGLSPFERDLDTIENAGRSRLAYLDRQASGAHGDDARRLGREVRQAMRELMEPATRDACERFWAEQWQVPIGAPLAFDHPPDAGASQAGSPAAPSIPLAAENVAPRPPHLSLDRAAEPPPLPLPLPLPLPSSAAEPTPPPVDEPYPAIPVTANGSHARRRRRSTTSRWVATLLVAAAFLPIHGLIAYFGWRIATGSPSSESPSNDAPTQASRSNASLPDEAAPNRVTPPIVVADRQVLRFAPGQSAVWPQVASWWDRSAERSIELLVTIPGSFGFAPIVGIYSGPESPAAGSDRWRGWVLGVERRISAPDAELVLRIRGENRNIENRWSIPSTPNDDRGPRHLAIVLDRSRATMSVDGSVVASIGASELRGNEPNDGALWLGSGSTLGETGAWRGDLHALRVSGTVRELGASLGGPNGSLDADTLLLFDGLSARGAVGATLRDRSTHRRDGQALGARWTPAR